LSLITSIGKKYFSTLPYLRGGQIAFVQRCGRISSAQCAKYFSHKTANIYVRNISLYTC